MNRVEFFDRVPAMPWAERQRVQWAYALSKKWFEGKERDSGERSFEHMRGVANILIDYGYTDAMYLILGMHHDCPEDTTIPISMLEQLYGPEAMREMLVLSKTYGIEDPLTGFVHRTPERPPEEYFGGILRAGKRVVIVKSADRIFNLTDLIGEVPEGSRWTPAKRLKQAAETRQWIIPMTSQFDQRMAEKLDHQCTLIELTAK